jgi:lipopolysaccharide/colanic/teichoic acid biosynthesis glycosyltransferase
MQRAVKRGLDLLLVLLCAPLALLLVGPAALAVKIESPGPALFLQQRIGKGGRPFVIVKLRTMVDGAAEKGAGLYLEKNDPRFTRVGLFLRRTSIDEVPQLWNVLKGEMSFVGPRPMPPFVVERYRDEYARILTATPGITGLAQVSGRNELVRSERLAIDIDYAEHWSLWLDQRIVARTFAAVLSGDGQRFDMSEAELER